MSESEIIASIESYLGRQFDDDDLTDLRHFLSSLQKQRVAKPEKKATPEKLRDLQRFKSNTSIVPTTTEKPAYIKQHTPDVDSSSFLEERLGPAIKGPAVKDRLGNWQEKIAQEETGATDPNLKAERLAEIKGAGVKDRLGNWQEKLAHEETAATNPNLKAERLAEIKGAGVKDRLGNWQEKLAQEETAATNPNLKAERLAEVKSITGVKDRLGAYQAAAAEENKSVAKAVPREELQGASGVKDRLSKFTAASEETSVKNPSVEDVQELKKSISVQQKLASWNNPSQDESIAANPSVIAERTAEAKAGGGVKDRLKAFVEASTEPEVTARKEPIKIDYGF